METHLMTPVRDSSVSKSNIIKVIFIQAAKFCFEELLHTNYFPDCHLQDLQLWFLLIQMEICLLVVGSLHTCWKHLCNVKYVSRVLSKPEWSFRRMRAADWNATRSAGLWSGEDRTVVSCREADAQVVVSISNTQSCFFLDYLKHLDVGFYFVCFVFHLNVLFITISITLYQTSCCVGFLSLMH